MAAEQLPDEITGGIDPDATWLSILQFFVKEDSTEDFERLMEEMYESAQKQPGFLWGNYGRSQVDGRWFVVSEWDSRANIKAWEDEERHAAVGEDAKTYYEAGRDMQNRKWVAWYKPGSQRKAWTK
jgi:heme-degrading monooxygenase HmoA